MKQKPNARFETKSSILVNYKQKKQENIEHGPSSYVFFDSISEGGIEYKPGDVAIIKDHLSIYPSIIEFLFTNNDREEMALVNVLVEYGEYEVINQDCKRIVPFKQFVTKMKLIHSSAFRPFHEKTLHCSKIMTNEETIKDLSKDELNVYLNNIREQDLFKALLLKKDEQKGRKKKKRKYSKYSKFASRSNIPSRATNKANSEKKNALYSGGGLPCNSSRRRG